MSELNDLEQQFRRLAPAADLDRDAILFRAGRASAPRPWGWIAATALSTAAAVFLALRPTSPPPAAPPPPPPAVHDVEPSAPPPILLAPPVRRLEEELLDRGLDALGRPAPLQPPSLPGGLDL